MVNRRPGSECPQVGRLPPGSFSSRHLPVGFQAGRPINFAGTWKSGGKRTSQMSLKSAQTAAANTRREKLSQLSPCLGKAIPAGRTKCPDTMSDKRYLTLK
jgi:hypothetical protein